LAARTTPADAAAIRAALLRWFRREARPLPWRGTSDPYAIWVSEVMLQQTRVATVIPYYRRFLKGFPSIRRLAQAPLERVLRYWSGLGYYRRARHLQQAARVLAATRDAQFPRDYERTRTLPGIGDYTARAVLSIAYRQPYTVLDGNVARVIARLLAVKGNLHERAFRSAMEAALECLLSRREPGDFNQALMQLGQVVCLPRGPQCPRCPLRKWCEGYRRGTPESFPEPRPRRATETRHLAVAVIEHGAKLALVRGLDEGLLPDLWNFPAAFGASQAEALQRLRKKLRELARGTVTLAGPLAPLRHGITYRAIQVDVHPASISGRARNDFFRWVPLATASRGAVSQLTRKIAQEIFRQRTITKSP
jgi:A/G-specific adenine glycosylase